MLRNLEVLISIAAQELQGYGTPPTLELIEYLRAMRKAEITEKRIQTNSDISLWLQIDCKIFEIAADQEIGL